MYTLKNVCISGEGVVFKNGRIFIPSLTWLKDLELYRNGKFLLRQWFGKKKRFAKFTVVALAYDQWSAENYYHWMIESLPRLLLIKKAFPDCLLLLPDPAPGFTSATAAMLGFRNLIPFKKEKGPVLQVPHLIMPELVYYEYTEEEALAGRNTKHVLQTEGRKDISTGVELIVEVREMLLGQLPVLEVPPYRKVFISRSRQKTRRLVNEDEVQQLLQKYGFEIMYFEEMPFEQQVRIMKETAIVTGVHGANMVNLLFLPPQAKVIELMNERYVNDAYYLLAGSIGVPYYSLPCALALEAAELFNDSVALNDADLVVDVRSLEEVLRVALA